MDDTQLTLSKLLPETVLMLCSIMRKNIPVRQRCKDNDEHLRIYRYDTNCLVAELAF